MSSLEVASTKQVPEQSSGYNLEQAEAHKAFTQERADLNESIDASFLGLPEHAQTYLSENCTTSNHLSLAAHEAALLLQADSTILDDPDFAEFELDTCIEKTEVAAKTQILETEKEANEKRRTTVIGLRNDVAEAVSGKSSFTQIEKGKAYINSLDETPEVKAELIAWLESIETTAKQVTALAQSPQETIEIQQIFARTSFDLKSDSIAGTFNSFVVEAEKSGVLSENSKDKIAAKLQITRWSEPRDATDMFKKFDQIDQANGQFYNPKTKRLELFTPENGVPLGDYTVYPDEKHTNEFIAITKVGGRELRLHFNRDADPSYIDEMVSTAMIAQVLANRDLQAANQYILGGNRLSAQGVTDIRLDEYQTKRAVRLYGAFMGFGTKLRTGFPKRSELVEFERRLQATHIDGDAKTSDNTGRGDLSWKDIGMVDNNDLVNMSMVEAVGTYINGQDRTALPSYQELVAEFGQV